MQRKRTLYEDQVKDVILRNFENVPEAQIFLFGSRAEGTNEYNADYDVGVIMANGKEIDHKLMLKTKRELDDLIVKVDFVDFATKDEIFKKIALKNIKVWKNP